MVDCQTRIITILLTKYSSLFSSFISCLAGRGYSHASIATDDTMENFYSFNHKGFVIETLSKRIRWKAERTLCIQIMVSQEAYALTLEQIDFFIAQKERYKYSKIGTFLCLLHIPHKFQNQYFCSQFVAEMLSLSGVLELKRDPSLYLPNHFLKELTENQVVTLP